MILTKVGTKVVSKNFLLNFHLKLGKMMQFWLTVIFFKWVVQPPTSFKSAYKSHHTHYLSTFQLAFEFILRGVYLSPAGGSRIAGVLEQRGGRRETLRKKKGERKYMGVSKNRSGPPKSSILIGFSIIHHPFSGTLVLGNSGIFPLTHTYANKIFDGMVDSNSMKCEV